MTAQPNALKRIVVLISGSGTNLKTIIENCKPTALETISQPIDAEVVAVFSNQAQAGGLQFARDANIPTQVILTKDYPDREAFDKKLAAQILQYKPDLVVLAGYMLILTADFVHTFTGKLINIHPSLLPKYPGLNTHKRAIENGDTEHGTSIHFVDSGLDSGPVILQAKVPIFPGDDEIMLIERVKYQEHQIYPLVIKWFIDGRLLLKDKVAYLDGKALDELGYAS
ncbi:phosphoribosylglycinamide formyltransferase [Thorsellia anophelis]|uniref:Phosphoribosylglycinamide formyltransferase n=1 Tax=Thorsellia anophelis DSM 18579 TaxID=1123402 RepID=A0A1I0E2R6_9GAMM|nr:phosphoribosylglycinamide formyltransferase [Thorsellia anophelis]SET39388.1 phosphoribosylglycinamide formyltransferase-1 [Thorsellia anophelis DSM 18579]